MGYTDLSTKTFARGSMLRATVAGLPILVEGTHSSRGGGSLGRIKHITFHWTVGSYVMCYDDYHANVVFDQTKRAAHVVKTLKTSEKGEHAYLANSHNYGITFCAMQKTDPKTGAGKYPITSEMLAAGAQYAAEICLWHKLDPEQAITDHYRVDRWPGVNRREKIDIGFYFEDLKADILRRYEALKAGAPFQYRGLLRTN